MSGGAALFIIVAIFLVIFGVLGAVLWVVLKKTDPKNQDTTENPQIKEAQAFLPFTDIRDGMIMLPNQRYRMVLECSSLNYNLKTPAERDQIELSFHRFLNTISFPITFFLQTKTIDNRERLAMLDKNIEEALSLYPGIRSYAQQYRKDMEELNTKIGNSHQKKRYIIITYDEVGTLDSLSAEEQEVYARKELLNRCTSVRSNLEGVGVNSHVLETPELIELIYSCYYRDDYSYAEAISDKEAFSLFVHGTEDKFHDMSKNDLLALLCGEMENRINLENLDQTEKGARMLAFLNELKGGTLA